MTIMRMLLFFAGAAAVLAMPDMSARTPFEGLSGASLAGAIRREAMPETLIMNQTGAGSVWSVIKKYALGADGSVHDYFGNGEGMRFPDNPYEAPDGLTLVEVCPSEWWMASPDSRSPVYDMQNLIYARDPQSGILAGRIPASDVGNVLYSDAGWLAGTTAFGSVDVAVYMPPENFRGDFARMLMYCATVYPCPLWHGEAAMIYADGETWPPLLSAYASRLLMEWHRADPPDDFERLRNSVISQAQGGSNPFVEYPELAEYLWGEKAGDTFVDPDNRERTPLKAVYSRSADAFVDFYSPYITAEAEWVFDGKPLGADPAPVAVGSLPTGRYLIEYSAAGGDIAGSLFIDIIE